MNGNNIIEARKQSIAEEKKFIATKTSANGFWNGINNIGRVFFGITGALLLIGGMPGVGLAFVTTAIANHISLKNRGIEEQNKLDFLEKEEEHIANLANNPINGSREMTARRINKVRELEAKKEKTHSKKKWSSFANGFSNVFQWAALTAAVCVPAVGWVSCLSLASKYLSSKSKIESAKEDDKLALRINNLNLDLELTRAKQPSARAAVRTIDERENQKANQTTRQKVSSSIDDERLVDSYIASLENIGEPEKPKTFRK